MKVQLLQLDIAWRDVDANIQRVERMMHDAAPADLYLLPEMWATGFDVSPSADTLAQSQKALAWMRDTSRHLQAHIAGTLPWAEDGRVFNRLFVISPQGEILAQYDKRHLFAYGGDLTFDVNFFRMPAAATVALTLSVYKPHGKKGMYVSGGVGLPF